MSIENKQRADEFVLMTDRPIAESRHDMLADAFKTVCERAGYVFVDCSVTDDRIALAVECQRPHVAKYNLQVRGEREFASRHTDARVSFARVYYTGSADTATDAGESADYRELQLRAKDEGIPANMSAEELREALADAETETETEAKA